MLVLPENSAIYRGIRGLSTLPDDIGWELVIHGSASLMAISAIAFQLLQFPPIRVFCWSVVGFTSGFLAKKSIGYYNFARSLSRGVITIEDRLPFTRVIACSIVHIVSFVFPTIAATFAVIVGACAGYLFRPHHEAT
jgi:hypothetical protein